MRKESPFSPIAQSSRPHAISLLTQHGQHISPFQQLVANQDSCMPYHHRSEHCFRHVILFHPKYTRVGYQPTQPAAFDHSLHVNQLGMDCRYCHTGVEKSSHSNVPGTQTCMNCHTQIKSQSSKLSAVRDSWKTGNPVPWVRIHKAPDYVYFNHAVHVNRGVSCVACHGHVNHMEVVYHAKPHSMGWCLECHRAPENHLRPLDQVTNLDWEPRLGRPNERSERNSLRSGM